MGFCVDVAAGVRRELREELQLASERQPTSGNPQRIGQRGHHIAARRTLLSAFYLSNRPNADA